MKTLPFFFTSWPEDTPHLLPSPWGSLGGHRAQFFTMCDLRPAPLAVAWGWGEVLCIFPYIGTCFYLENFLHSPQNFSLSLSFQLLHTHPQSCLKDDLLPRTVPPGEERGGGFEELRVGCRTAGWELGDFLTLVFPLAGCFPFWLVISLLWVPVSTSEKQG